MDTKLLKLYEEERLSNIAFKSLLQLIACKQIKDRHKWWLYSVSIVFLIIMGLLLYYLFTASTDRSNQSLFLLVPFKNMAIKHFLFPVLILFVIWMFVSRQYDEKNKDYENLRLQLIERSSDLWIYPIERDIQGEVYQQLKEVYDINLFYK